MRSIAFVFAFLSTVSIAAPAFAGDVVVTKKNGSLIVTADDPGFPSFGIDNAALSDGQFRVSALAMPTTINGHDDGVVFDGIHKDIRVEVKQTASCFIGTMTTPRDVIVHDVSVSSAITVDSTNVTRDLKLDLEGDMVTVGITAATVGRNLNLTTGFIHSNVLITTMTILGRARFKCDKGDYTSSLNGVTVHKKLLYTARDTSANAVLLDNLHVMQSARFKSDGYLGCAWHDSMFDKTLSVRGGSLGDSLDVQSCTIAKKLTVDFRGGNDFLQFGDVLCQTACDLRGGPENDNFSIAFSDLGKLSVDLGGGANTFATENQIEVDRLDVFGEGGDDVLTPKSITCAGDMNLFLGAGNNTVNFDTVAVGKDLFVKTGDGDDTITEIATTVAGNTKIHHGGGTDSVP